MCPKQTEWYLRKPDGSEYGPVTTDQLQRWAVQCRIVAGNGVSADHELWQKVEDLPELEMDWTAHRPDGHEYGPFNIAATQELFDHNVLPEDAIITHRKTKESVSVRDVLEGKSESEAKPEVAEEDEPSPPRSQNRKKTEPPEKIRQPVAEETEAQEKAPTVNAEQPSPESLALQAELEKLQGRLKRTQADLLQARKDLSTANAEREEIISGLSDERDEAIAALTALQSETETQTKQALSTSKKQEKALATATAHLAEAQDAYDQAKDTLSRLESERSEAEETALQSMAELRKQTAFMKKNNATLQSELETAKIKASSRGRALAILLTILAAILGILLLGPHRCRQTAKADPAISPAKALSTQDAVSEMPEKPEEPKATETKTSQVPNTKPAPWPTVMVEGVKTGRSENTLTLRFDNGVFTRLTTPSDAAKVQLIEIANILRPHLKDFRLVVEGHTDDQPLKATATYDGNYALGLARAEAIRELLITSGKLSGHAVSPTSMGEKNPPYPNNSEIHRVRNRTVVLKLVRL
jgi:flagellar motor protein MotB